MQLFRKKLNADANAVMLHLTGSRFFGNARPDSDYDYFTDNRDLFDLLKKLLVNSGIHHSQIYNCAYLDDETIEVIECVSHNVHVILCKDAKIKATAQDILMVGGYRGKNGGMTREQVQALWNAAYKLARTINGNSK